MQGRSPKAGDLKKEHDWWVFSTAIEEVVLMLECHATGSFGIVRKPTREEWNEAYYAPENPYRWKGGNDRVEIIRHGPTATMTSRFAPIQDRN